MTTKQILKKATGKRIIVVGDVMLDHFIWGNVSRISPEAPAPVLDYQREEYRLGGAANVAANIWTLGAQPILFGAVGNDDAARRLKYQSAGIDCRLLRSAPCTTQKTRVVSGCHHIARIDREQKWSPPREQMQAVSRRIIGLIKSSDAVILSDYSKGFVNWHLNIPAIRDECNKSGVWISAGEKARENNLAGMDLITLNRKEVFGLMRFKDETYNRDPLKDRILMVACREYFCNWLPKHLLVTLGELGSLLFCGNKVEHIPARARNVADVSGAGDTVIAAFTVAVISGATPREAAEFANQAAGIVVGKPGTATVCREEMAG